MTMYLLIQTQAIINMLFERNHAKVKHKLNIFTVMSLSFTVLI